MRFCKHGRGLVIIGKFGLVTLRMGEVKNNLARTGEVGFSWLR